MEKTKTERLSVWKKLKEIKVENEKVQNVIDDLALKNNIFITGPDGVGKTWLLKSVIQTLEANNIKCAITASTGILAINLGGITIHKLLWLSNKEFPEAIELMKSYSFFKINQDLKNVQFIIIDEISMIKASILDLIDLVLKKCFNNSKPFGGKTMIFCGDFLQLPPIFKKVVISENIEDLKHVDYVKWAFQAESWQMAEIKVYVLEKVYWQQDEQFIKALHSIRLGQKNEYTKWLINQMNQKTETLPTNLPYFVSRKVEAEKINDKQMEAIQNPITEYISVVTGKNENWQTFIKKNVIANDVLKLKIGTRVIAIKNGPDNQYCNGSLGTVLNLGKDNVTVLFDNRSKVIIKQETWKIEDIKGNILANFTQIPLLVAYAITIHKSQGLTLEGAIIAPKQIFENGQLYVALSRVKEINNLFLTSKIFDSKIRVDQDALKYNETITYQTENKD